MCVCKNRKFNPRMCVFLGGAEDPQRIRWIGSYIKRILKTERDVSSF
jgi:hypothetical protein